MGLMVSKHGLMRNAVLPFSVDVPDRFQAQQLHVREEIPDHHRTDGQCLGQEDVQEVCRDVP